MATLISVDYFWGKLAIAGINLPSCDDILQSSTKNNKVKELQMYIEKYEPIFIKKMFGTNLNGMVTNDVKALLYDDELKISPIANFVYYHYMKDTAVMVTNAGLKSSQIQNTRSISPDSKMVAAWNDMVDMVSDIHFKFYTLDDVGGTIYSTEILPYIRTTDDIFEPINVWNL